ncbi:PREDICTED: uncharacterized protein LOC108777771 [Cyphomyrmex costatus]|nr:PREDICTED: uncharacterized protein LOC108777771 [Cyphomyrmex costatus]
MDRLLITVLLCLYTSFKIAENQIIPPPCTEIGAFEIYDGTCKNYYICVDDGVNLTPVILSCASSAIFDPLQGRCVLESIETCQQTTTMASSTTAAPLCPKYGRFPILDVNCKRYYLCYWGGQSFTILDNLSCPNALIFNPMKEKCVSPSQYICPGITT